MYMIHAKLRQTIDLMLGEPADEVFEAQLSTDPDKRWKSVPVIVEHLKAKARKLGLWNLFLSGHAGGAGFTNLEYGLMCEILGRSLLSREAMNCSAPDTGNMEVSVTNTYDVAHTLSS
jgi:acyl-CoA dehydrogenase